MEQNQRGTEGNGIHGLRIVNYSGHPASVSPDAMGDIRSRLSVTDGGDVDPEDWDRLEKLKGLTELLNSVFFWCWTKDTPRGIIYRHPKAAQKRFLAMTALVRPDLIKEKSYDKIGSVVGITKQMMSLMAKDFQNSFGLKFQRSHKNGGNNSASAKKTWEKRKVQNEPA